jgi:hypothetical protein
VHTVGLADLLYGKHDLLSTRLPTRVCQFGIAANCRRRHPDGQVELIIGDCVQRCEHVPMSRWPIQVF